MIIRLCLLLAFAFSFSVILDSCSPPPAAKSAGSGSEKTDDVDDDDFTSDPGEGEVKVYYDPDIKEMMADECDECHADTGAKDPAMETYAEVKANADDILSQMKSGDMPKDSDDDSFSSLWSSDDDDDDDGDSTWGDDDDDEDDEDDDSTTSTKMTDTELVEAWIDAGMPYSSDSSGCQEMAPVVGAEAYLKCCDEGKMHSPSAVASGSDECAAELPTSFQCGSVEELSTSLKPEYKTILFEGGKDSSGEDVAGLQSLFDDEYTIYSCGESGGKPIVWLIKTLEGNIDYQMKYVP